MRWHGAGFMVDDLDYTAAETQDPSLLVEVAVWISMVFTSRACWSQGIWRGAFQRPCLEQILLLKLPTASGRTNSKHGLSHTATLAQGIRSTEPQTPCLSSVKSTAPWR